MALAALVALCATSAASEERIALVIGNGAYAAVTRLENPVSDATLIAASLTDLGFQVTLVTDADQAGMNAAIGAFGKALRKAGPDSTGLFYYAGHGVQSFGTNYILPVDAALTDAADLGLVGIEAESILRQMFSAKNRTNIVILDACRNNPFEDLPDMGDNGLAEMKAPTGTFLSYATAPGSVALDGADGNSPFTTALAEEIRAPGQPIEQVFKQVRVRVIDETDGKQTPWDTSSMTSEFAFVPAATLTAEEVGEQQLWDSVLALRDSVQVMLFLRAYPNSKFEPEARALLAEVMAEELAGVTEEPAPAAPSAAETAALTASEVPAATEPVKPEPVLPETVTFSAPLTGLGEALSGKSIEQLLKGSPMFSPIEGLDEAAWKDVPCTACHSWTREALCEQSKTYLLANAERALNKEHPLGGNFKLALLSWAKADCP